MYSCQCDSHHKVTLEEPIHQDRETRPSSDIPNSPSCQEIPQERQARKTHDPARHRRNDPCPLLCC